MKVLERNVVAQVQKRGAKEVQKRPTKSKQMKVLERNVVAQRSSTQKVSNETQRGGKRGLL
jgi:hypothetical protein